MLSFVDRVHEFVDERDFAGGQPQVVVGEIFAEGRDAEFEVA